MSADSDLASYQRDHGVSKTCLLRLDRPVLTLQIDLFAEDSVFDHIAAWGDGSCTAGADGATCADARGHVKAVTLQRFLLESSLDVTLRGSVFADPLRGLRIPLRSFHDAGDARALPAIAFDERGLGNLVFLNATL